MKTMLAVLVGTMAIGCSGEADIGIDSTPMMCQAQPVAEVTGVVSNPYDDRTFSFDSATPTLSANNTLVLSSNELRLQLGFYCGNPERTTYGVKPDLQTGLVCPLEVASSMTGQVEILQPVGGTVIIDETSDCLAGRFRVDFGEYGEVAGKFSAALPQ